MDCKEMKQECMKSSKWLRLFFMVIFGALSYFIVMLIWMISLFQFFYHLITGKTNQPLAKLSDSISEYVADIVKFLCYNDEQKPFPFSEWPSKKAKVKTKS